MCAVQASAVCARRDASLDPLLVSDGVAKGEAAAEAVGPSSLKANAGDEDTGRRTQYYWRPGMK